MKEKRLSQFQVANCNFQMRARKLIGLVGMKQVGKSTIGNHLQNQHGFKTLSFAAPLKRICSETFHIPPENFELTVTKELPDLELKVSPRHIMQAVGTGLFRNTLPQLLPDMKLGCDSIWIYSMKKELEKYSTDHVVITDVRFSDECKFLKENGGVLIYIDRWDKEQQWLDQHESESAYLLKSQCDVIIDNTTSVEFCLEQVDLFIDQI